MCKERRKEGGGFINTCRNVIWKRVWCFSCLSCCVLSFIASTAPLEAFWHSKTADPWTFPKSSWLCIRSFYPFPSVPFLVQRDAYCSWKMQWEAQTHVSLHVSSLIRIARGTVLLWETCSAVALAIFWSMGRFEGSGLANLRHGV